MEGSVMVSVCAMSDLHGFLPKVEPCDLVLICGDIVPLKYQSDSELAYDWYEDYFKEWAENLKCDKVLFIAGNHECTFPVDSKAYQRLFPENSKVTYLEDSQYNYRGLDGKTYSIYGTPYCQIFGTWAFMLPDSKLREKYSEIPENLDILITHDAPYGVSDVLLQKECKWATGEHIGNVPLRNAIIQKCPKYVFHGHLHSTSHEFELLENSKVVNCSLKDEFYNVLYKPIIVDL